MNINLNKLLETQEVEPVMEALKLYKTQLKNARKEVKLLINTTINKKFKDLSKSKIMERMMHEKVKHPLKDTEVLFVEYLLINKVILADLYKKQLTVELTLKKLETINSLVNS